MQESVFPRARDAGPGTHSDLDRVRDRINELYVVDERPLRDVMDILRRETGCVASYVLSAPNCYA